MVRSSQVISEYFCICYRDSIIMRRMAGHTTPHHTTATVLLSFELFFAIDIVVILNGSSQSPGTCSW